VDREHLIVTSTRVSEIPNVSFLKSSIEKRRDKFINYMLIMPHYKPVLEAYARSVCGSLEQFVYITVLTSARMCLLGHPER